MAKSITQSEVAKPLSIVINEQEIVIKRWALNQVFRALELFGDGFAEFMDALAGGVDYAGLETAALLEQQADDSILEEDAIRLRSQADVERHKALNRGVSWATLVKVISTRGEVVKEVVALALDKDLEWVGENVTLEHLMEIISIVLIQEFTKSFFASFMKLKGLWATTKTNPAEKS